MTVPRHGEPLRLVHHHPGLVRARANVFVDVGEEHPAVASARATAAAAPIRRFSHAPTTGSILIEYAPGTVDPDELLERIAKEVGLSGVVHDASDKAHRAELVDTLLEAFKTINELALEATKGRADFRELVPGALALTSVAALLSGGGGRGFLPRWEVALWFCQTWFVQWHHAEIARKSGETDASSP